MCHVTPPPAHRGDPDVFSGSNPPKHPTSGLLAASAETNRHFDGNQQTTVNGRLLIKSFCFQVTSRCGFFDEEMSTVPFLVCVRDVIQHRPIRTSCGLLVTLQTYGTGGHACLDRS